MSSGMKARARVDDPVSSHLAAQDAERGGSASTQRLDVLNEVRRKAGQTSAEIAANLGLERHAPPRRLPELRDAGFVFNGNYKTCSITGRRSLTWCAVFDAEERMAKEWGGTG